MSPYHNFGCLIGNRLVKDNRTNVENTSPEKVLDGQIDEFLESSLFKIYD